MFPCVRCRTYPHWNKDFQSGNRTEQVGRARARRGRRSGCTQGACCFWRLVPMRPDTRKAGFRGSHRETTDRRAPTNLAALLERCSGAARATLLRHSRACRSLSAFGVHTRDGPASRSEFVHRQHCSQVRFRGLRTSAPAPARQSARRRRIKEHVGMSLNGTKTTAKRL